MKAIRLFPPFLILLTSLFFSCRKEVIIRYTDPEVKGDTIYITAVDSKAFVSIQDFNVLPDNSPQTNKANLQSAIDWAEASGTALYVTPAENGYPVDGGLILKNNVSLVGAHGPTGRGTVNSKGDGPTGSLFVITDQSVPFITMESASRIEGVQFYYPDQAYRNASGIIEYPPTIQMSKSSDVKGVTLRDLTFYGEYSAMDFEASGSFTSEQILFEDCYGYPLSGRFISIDGSEDSPRILHCHVNPANMREFGRSFNSDIIDAVVSKGTYTYSLKDVDNAVLMDLFTFGTYGGVCLGENTSGQMTSFNFDCVNRGICRIGAEGVSRSWLISQGSIIANVGESIEEVHSVILKGTGYTSLFGVELFSGSNGALSNLGAAYDFLYVDGDSPLTVAVTNCRMSGYTSADPFTIINPNAMIRAASCVDKFNAFFDYEHIPGLVILSGMTIVYDSCDELSTWITGNSSSVSKDANDKQEGESCVSVEGTSNVVFAKRRAMPMDTRTTLSGGHLKLSLFVSDVSMIDFSKEGAIEISSSGSCDVEELAWRTSSLNLKSGWNDLDLEMRSGAVTGGEPDLRAVNYFRFYQFGIENPVTFKIDDIRFCQE